MLGLLCWYDVLDSDKVSFDQFNAAMQQYGVTVRKMNPPKVSDLFRRACNYASLYDVEGPNDPVSFVCQKAGHDTKKVYYKIVLTENGKTGIIGTLTLDREEGTVDLETDKRVPYVDLLEFKIQYFMEQYGAILPTIQVRESLRQNIEESCGGIRMKETGGIYFVPLSHQEIFEGTKEAFNSLDRCLIYSVPLLHVPDHGQKLMIQERFMNAIQTELDTIWQTSLDIPAEKVEMRVINKLFKEIETVSERVETTKEILEPDMYNQLQNQIALTTIRLEGVYL